jgi:hypothetical protein
LPGNRKIIFAVPRDVSERNPSRLRGFVSPQLERVKTALMGSQIVFIVSSLGGAVGSAIAPLVAKCAKQVRAMVVGIVAMPFVFEKAKHFFAGCALRQLTGSCDGVMLLENQIMMLAGEEELSLVDANACLNEKISLFINALVEPIENDGIGSGVENVVDYFRANPYSVLRSSANGGPGPNVKTEEASRTSDMLVTYESRENVDTIISSYDPVDACLRKLNAANLDPDPDSSFGLGQGVLRDIEE